MAVNDRRKNQAGEWIDETTFVDVTLWGRTAEVAGQYLSKGSSLLIEGRLKLDTWETDGQKRSKLRVVADRMQMLGGRGGGAGGGGGGGRSQPHEDGNVGQPVGFENAGPGPAGDDDIPF
jgi:single-strand DNA-binding protein